MSFTVTELLAWAAQHEGDAWATLSVRRIPFRYHVTGSGIEYTTGTGNLRNVPRKELASFCAEFQELGSFSPGDYPQRWHKSYSLPLIHWFLQSRE
jgi:hypothetical protein